MISLSKYPYFAFDTETTGLQYKVDTVFGFSISTPDGQDLYYDIRKNPEKIRQLNNEIKHYNGRIICHKASFDYLMSKHTGIFMPLDAMDCTIIRACTINEHLPSYELDYLGKKYIGMRKDTDIYAALAELFGGPATRKSQIGNIQHAPIDLVAKYAKLDTRITLKLWEWQEEEIERQQIRSVIDFERLHMPTVIRRQEAGIRVDTDYAEQAADKLTPIIDKLQGKLNSLAGCEVNANSPPQCKALFAPYEEDGEWFASDGTPLGKTPKGNASLGAEALRSLSDPKAQLILDIRSLLKTRDTFLRGHVIGHSVGGRVYPDINQSKGEDGGTGTGRFSYTNPAMQQIPSRNKEVAAIVKPCFLPDDGFIWVDTDMASFEVRVFAHLINNPEIINAYFNNPHMDLHQFVADITGLVRNAEYSGQPNAKQLNLSMIFNSGNGAIANKMGMPWSWESFEVSRGKDKGKKITYRKAGPEAMEVINRYHRRIPGIKELADGCKRVAEEQGYVRTYTGRRLRFPGGFKAYSASGLLIQSTAAELNKENWRTIESVLGDRGSLILNTHDSYSMQMDPATWQEDYRAVQAEIEREGRVRVPLILDFSGTGHNWWDALNNKLEGNVDAKSKAVA